MLRLLARQATKSLQSSKFKFSSNIANVIGKRRKITTSSSALNQGVYKDYMNNFASNAVIGRLGLKVRDLPIAAWFFGSASMVFVMIILGGVTRLTRSGLSMTDWKPQGSLPPLTALDWEFEFEKYKLFPEYQKLNQSMTMEEFKFIYYMEWSHRMWGRFMGVAFAVPGLYFLSRGRLTPQLKKQVAIMFTLGGAQGGVGWWMVKSGLEQPKSEYKEPRVSPYRLTAHLSMATLIYSMLVYNGLSALNPHGFEFNLNLSANSKKMILALRRRVKGTMGLIAVTLFSGAFVAGNDAGHAYNSFPKMGDYWVPPEILDMKPLYMNFFENTALVQMNHRILAMSTFSTVVALFAHTRLNPLLFAILPTPIQNGFYAILGASFLQVSLGITTLLLYVPVSIGTMHQAGGILLWTTALFIVHSLRIGGRVPNSRSLTTSLQMLKRTLIMKKII